MLVHYEKMSTTLSSSILSEICCPICKEIYLDPKILPCGKSVCSECIPDQEEFECEICSQTHNTTSAELLKDDHLTSIIDQHIQLCEKDINVRSYKIKIIRKLIKDLKEQPKSKLAECEALLDAHCSSVKNSIDLKTECMIESLRNENQNLLDQVNKLREESMNKLSAQFNAKAERLTNLETAVEQLSLSDKPNDQEHQSLTSYIEGLIINLLTISLLTGFFWMLNKLFGRYFPF